MEQKKQEMIDSLRSGRVATLEKESDLQDFPSFFSSNEKPKPLAKPIFNLKNEKQDKAEAEKILFPERKALLPENANQIKQEEISQPITSVEPATIEKSQVDVVQLTDSVAENNMEELQSDVAIQTPAPTKKRFRIRLLVATMCMILCCLIGLTIYNAVEIDKLNSSISSSQTEYNVNVASYINKINGLDELTSDDNVVERNENNTNSLIPITKKINSQSLALSEPEAPSVKTNWFDKFIDKIRNLFGG